MLNSDECIKYTLLPCIFNKSTVRKLNDLLPPIREHYFEDLIHAYKLNITQFQHVAHTLRTRYAHVTAHVTPFSI